MWNADVQAKRFLEPSPENERYNAKLGLTPSEALRMGPFASIHAWILEWPL